MSEKLYVVQRFKQLKKQKSLKVKIMKDVRKFIHPEDGDLVREDILEDEILFDTTARNLIENYTFESLADIINPFEPWFNLNIKKTTNIDKTIVEEWAKIATEEFFVFISDSSYYSSIISDKANYDVYGFSGMSILEKKNKEGLKIVVEDPFELVINDDRFNDQVDEIYWMIYVDLKTLRDHFEVTKEVVDVHDMAKMKNKYKILCCITPNDDLYVRQADPEKGKYVFSTYYLGEERQHANQSGVSRSEGDSPISVSSGSDEQEIGSRKYFSRPFLVVPRDIKSSRNSYGVGNGKRLLVEAQNLNQIRKNVLRTSANYADPPHTMPYDVYVRYESGNVKLRPGEVVQSSITGQEIKPIVPQIDYSAQVNLLQYEDSKIRESIPQQRVPDKRARQSQFEVDSNNQRTAQLQLIYKVIYLKEAVSEHLKLMFEIALKQNRITPLPNGLDIKDVEPSLSNLLLKEYKKAKAQAYVQSLSLAQGFIASKIEAMDNIDTDVVLRNIFLANGGGDAVLDEDTVDEVRERREQQIAEQNQANLLEQENLSSQTELNKAQAGKANAETLRTQNELTSE